MPGAFLDASENSVQFQISPGSDGHENLCAFCHGVSMIGSPSLPALHVTGAPTGLDGTVWVDQEEARAGEMAAPT